MLSILLALAVPAGTAADDRAAVARMARGEHDAVAELYDRHGRLLYSLALRIVRDRGDAEDVVQEAFSQAWRQAARFDGTRGSVAAWLVTLVRTRAIDLVRRRRARPPLDDAPPLGDTPDDTPSVEDQIDWQSRATDVRRALDDLPLLQRIAVELAFYEGLTHAEIAEQLEVPLGTVKTRVRQGLLRLRHQLVGGAS